jgi:hypothetical protein
MTLQKNNRIKEYVKELQQIQYDYLQNSFTPPLERRFWEKREELIKINISNYLNSNTNDT